MSTPTTFGTLTWHETGSIESGTWSHRPNDRPLWGITALPHVTMRLKRIFASLSTTSKGTMYLADTIQNAREIEWVLNLFPLEMDNATAERLKLGASMYREREQAINDILGGHAGQPSLVLSSPGMTPRDYQLEYVALIERVNRLLLGDGTGVGKTISAGLGFALPDALPALVAMPTHLPAQWQAKMLTLWPMLRPHVLKGTRPYDLRTARGSKGHYPDILLTPYSRLAGWSEALAGQVKTVVFDEVQELRTGRSSEKGKGAARLSEAATYVVGASATPAHNYGGEFWNVLDIINPGALGTREEFLREWGSYGYYGDKPRINDPAAFGTYLRSAGLMLARSRKDVGIELGDDPIIEVESIGTDPKALAAIDQDVEQIARMILSADTSNKDKFVLGGQLDWKLRQATGVAKAPMVAEYVRLLLDSEEKIVLYGWHRACYDIWLDKLRDFNPVLFTGSESPAQKEKSRQAFMLPNGQPGASRVMVISLASGAGLDGLQDVCSAVVFGELDWSPKVHSQAIDRVHRPGQTSPVLVVYLVSEDGSDPVVAEVLDLKAQNTDPVMTPDAALFELRPGATDAAGAEVGRVRALAEAWAMKNAPALLEASA